MADGGEGNESYDEIDYTQPTVLVVGSEAEGVSRQALEVLANGPATVRKVRIPMTRELESFNAAIAASIILAEAARQRRRK